MEKNVQDFKMSYESPRLYLDNYFSDTRNRVDIEAELKIIKFNADSNVHDKINQIRQGMINKIDSFEEIPFKTEKLRAQAIFLLRYLKGTHGRQASNVGCCMKAAV